MILSFSSYHCMSRRRSHHHSCSAVWTFVVVAVAALVSGAAAAATQKEDSPSFFLQDPTDNLCLSGTSFTRCSLDTLFYVSGTAGSYQIHQHHESDDSSEGDMCLAKPTCDDAAPEDLKVALCSHCGAQAWNILGEADTGFVLTQNAEHCVVRHKDDNTARLAPCDSTDIPYTPLQLRFVSATDLATMRSPAAQIVGAAADGKVEDVRKLWKDGVDFDGLTPPASAAAAGGHLDVVKFIIQDKGADVNVADSDGITALMEASITGQEAVVALLLEEGATADVTTASQVTALWLASSAGHTATVQKLLSKSADAKVTRSDGVTALMAAATGGHREVVNALLEAGADASAVDQEGMTALMNGAEQGSGDTVEALIKAAPDVVDALSHQGYSALIVASAHGKLEAVQALLKVGAKQDALGETKVTALMFAVAGNHVETAQTLLDAGADLEAVHNNGGTALLEASTVGAVDALRLLMDKGAVVDVQDDDGVTPLMAIASFGSKEGHEHVLNALKTKMSAAELKDYINLFSFSGGSTVMFSAAGGHLEITKDLLEMGADAKAIARATPEYLAKLTKMIEEGTVQNDDPHIDGVTALHVAAQGGHIDVVNLLLTEAGADPLIADDEGRTPLSLAIKGEHADTATALVKGGADPNMLYKDIKGVTHNLLFDAIMLENEEFAKTLIELGATPYYMDEKKVTTLLQACHRGLTEIVKLLLEKHAASGKPGYIDDASDEGVSPLIASASEGHLEAIKHLIAAKANLDFKDNDSTTALMAAAARGHLDVVEELLRAGAAVNEQNSDGHTALMFAYNGKNQVDTLWERYSQYLKEADEGEDLDDSGTGPLIREALDKHIALIELLMKNGANPALKDKEGHTAKDFDYHPDQDADVLHKEALAEKIRDESRNEL